MNVSKEFEEKWPVNTNITLSLPAKELEMVIEGLWHLLDASFNVDEINETATLIRSLTEVLNEAEEG